ncbi:hypothetical protein EMPS_06442 [Entomortierella parvispora]|uniref:Uncharacterized protein n=1 Tax=Entomortierella parvispora TaxID=205924 RepID=A0A9P3HCB3_9FUNG|nr:hypothetical protein EMPS_06442 [Entomortierella parvispora]
MCMLAMTSLMRNQEATSQICVNCEINPPVDIDEPLRSHSSSPTELTVVEQSQVDDKEATPEDTFMAMPAPTSALPSIPPSALSRSISPPNHRSSVLDTVLGAGHRKGPRAPSGRSMGISAPLPPLMSAPRSSTLLPMPPKTPPPLAKSISGPLRLGTPISRPAGPPPLPAGPPPPAGSTPVPPQLTPRDRRRSPQSSIVAPSSDSPSPSPPPQRTLAQIRADLQASGGQSSPNNTSSDVEPVLDSAAVQNDEGAHSPAGITEHDQDGEQGIESHDEFEDAEEEVYRPTAQEVQKRDSQRELMGERMLQGWAMLQDPCPNPTCNGVPLMRNREKKEFCVMCENYYQREMDLEHGKYTIVPTGPTIPAPIDTRKQNTRTGGPSTRPSSQASSRSSHYRATSPLSSPSQGRATRDLNGRISSSIVLPPAVASSNASFGMTSQQIMNRQLSSDLDRAASEDEETRKHLQLISKVSEFSSRSLPPVPPIPAAHASANSTSRPTSTYSNSSGNTPLDKERYHRPLSAHHENHHTQGSAAGSQPQPPPVPLAPEVQALVDATHRTITTLLTKVEVYRLALEMSDNTKECQVLTNHIKGLMECLRACRGCL